MIVATIVPNNYAMPFEAVKSWIGLVSLPLGLHFTYWTGPSLPDNRNRVVDVALETGDDLLFIDSDIVFKELDAIKIKGYLDDGYDAVTGIYVIGKPPYPPCVFKRVEGDYEKMPIPSEFCEIGACGGGFLGISGNTLAKLGRNPFSNIWEGHIQHGEDISFCHRLHEAGLKLWCDPEILVGQARMTIEFPKRA